MILLALDTALSAATVVVAKDGGVLALRCEPMARGHQEAIALLTQAAMAEAGVAFRELDRIAVTVGPGSFTGLRVGLAFAKGLALAWRTPLVGIGSLEALAASVTGERIVAAIDAGRGHIYWQAFVGGDAFEPPQQLPIEIAAERTAAFVPDVVVGSGAALTATATARLDPRDHADPLALSRLAAAAAEPVGPPVPLYLRAPDAKTLAERGIVR